MLASNEVAPAPVEPGQIGAIQSSKLQLTLR